MKNKEYKLHEVVVRTDSTVVHTETMETVDEESADLLIDAVDGAPYQLVFSTTDKKQAKLFADFMAARDKKVEQHGRALGVEAVVSQIIDLAENLQGEV
jgi:hypothetical protein